MKIKNRGKFNFVFSLILLITIVFFFQSCTIIEPEDEIGIIDISKESSISVTPEDKILNIVLQDKQTTAQRLKVSFSGPIKDIGKSYVISNKKASGQYESNQNIQIDSSGNLVLGAGLSAGDAGVYEVRVSATNQEKYIGSIAVEIQINIIATFVDASTLTPTGTLITAPIKETTITNEFSLAPGTSIKEDFTITVSRAGLNDASRELVVTSIEGLGNQGKLRIKAADVNLVAYTVTLTGNNYYYTGTKTLTITPTLTPASGIPDPTGTTVSIGDVLTNQLTLASGKSIAGDFNPIIVTVDDGSGNQISTSEVTATTINGVGNEKKIRVTVTANAGVNAYTIKLTGNDDYYTGTKSYTLTVIKRNANTLVVDTSAKLLRGSFAVYPISSLVLKSGENLGTHFTVSSEEAGNANSPISALIDGNGIKVTATSDAIGNVATITLTAKDESGIYKGMFSFEVRALVNIGGFSTPVVATSRENTDMNMEVLGFSPFYTGKGRDIRNDFSIKVSPTQGATVSFHSAYEFNIAFGANAIHDQVYVITLTPKVDNIYTSGSITGRVKVETTEGLLNNDLLVLRDFLNTTNFRKNSFVLPLIREASTNYTLKQLVETYTAAPIPDAEYNYLLANLNKYTFTVDWGYASTLCSECLERRTVDLYSLSQSVGQSISFVKDWTEVNSSVGTLTLNFLSMNNGTLSIFSEITGKKGNFVAILGFYVTPKSSN